MKGDALAYQISWCHDPEHCNMHPYHAENHKSSVCWSKVHWTNQTLLINCSERINQNPNTCTILWQKWWDTWWI